MFKHPIYKHLNVIDHSQSVWVDPVDNLQDSDSSAKTKWDHIYDNGVVIVLMGPTGSGKSSFIEAIASTSTREPLGIAKDQLDSVTQKPCLYEIKNIRGDRSRPTIYIMDMPGLADPRISEMQVLDKLMPWRDRSQDVGYVRFLYFHPITDIRMPASRKRCIEMMRVFMGGQVSRRTVLVTSMWNRLSERSKKAAEERHAQLSENHWGDWAREGSEVCKFENTFESAIYIIDNILQVKFKNTPEEPPAVTGFGGNSTMESPVYVALFDRIATLEQHRDMLMQDLQNPDAQEQTELLTILANDLIETEILLQKFKLQMEYLMSYIPKPKATPTPIEPPTISPLTLPLQTIPQIALNQPHQDSQPPSRHNQISLLPKRLKRWIGMKTDKSQLGGSMGQS